MATFPNNSESDVNTVTSKISTNHQDVLQETIRNFLTSVTGIILPHSQNVVIQGTLGFTVDSKQVLLVHITETVSNKEKEKRGNVKESAPAEPQVPSISKVYSLHDEECRSSSLDMERNAASPVVIQPVDDFDNSALSTRQAISPVQISSKKGTTKFKSIVIKNAVEHPLKKVNSSDSNITAEVKVEKGSQVPSVSQTMRSSVRPLVQGNVVGSLSECSAVKERKKDFSKTLASLAASSVHYIKTKSTSSYSSPGMLRSLVDGSLHHKPYHLRHKRQPRGPSGALTSYSSLDLGLSDEASKNSDHSDSYMNLDAIVPAEICPTFPPDNSGKSIVSPPWNLKENSVSEYQSSTLLGMLLTGDMSVADMQKAGIQGNLVGGTFHKTGNEIVKTDETEKVTMDDDFIGNEASKPGVSSCQLLQLLSARKKDQDIQ